VYNHYESGPWSSEYFKRAHNDYIELLTETGVVGFGLLAWFFVGVGIRLIGGAKKISSKNIPLLAGVLAALGGMALHSSIDFSLQIPANALLFTVLMAIGLRLVSSREHSARRVDQSVASMAPWEIGDQSSVIRTQWSEVRDQNRPTGSLLHALSSRLAGATPLAAADARMTPYAVSLLALVLMGCAVTQEEEPRRPRSIAEARDRLLWRPFKASYHLSVIGRVGDHAPLDWQLREYQAALWIQPTNPYIRDKIAEILMAMGTRDEGLKEITLSVAHSPSLQEHEYLSAKSLPELSAAERDAVEAGFKQALAWNYPEAFGGLGEFYAKLERFSDQARLYEQAALKEADISKKTDLLMNAGLAYLKASDEQGAGSANQRSEVRSQKSEDARDGSNASNATNAQRNDSDEKNSKSEIRNAQTDNAMNAERVFRAAIAANPTDPKPYQQLVTAIYGPRQDLAGAKEVINRGIENKAPALPLYLSLAEAAQKAGSEQESKAALKSAKVEVEKLIRRGENPYTLYTALADGASKAGDREQEITALLKALDLQPRSTDTLSRLANLYFVKQNFDRAALYLNRIATINPDSPDLYYRLALAEEARYRFADAGRAYARAIQLAPQNESYRNRYEEFKARVDGNRVMADRGHGLNTQTDGKEATAGETVSQR
jgi:tetratricopeptide (TPR) repeat protein